MKLYFSPGSCSLAPHIVAREASLPFELVRVDLATHKTADGEDFYKINPRGYTPALEVDGEVHTESAALVQYLAEMAPEAHLMPPRGTAERQRMKEWLSFISLEVHKAISPWLFQSTTAESTRQAIHEKLAIRFAELDALLEKQPFLTGSSFTVADAYAFTIVNWTNFVNIDLAPYPYLRAYMKRIAERPKVQEALHAEGLSAEGGKA
ncbi:glutathione transferase GstA [Massilia endophytica]|uniref:glutathione transferase GstA n=1 Tax=Massilia endophytica TaxID=2899220 RepID=UPI001E4BB95C|nr:glutathione transferase GstA [Massilia endophytica]UGQ46641.1 glutathione transferase GstA [Massilia endophytica]